MSLDPPPDDLQAVVVSAAEFVEYGLKERDKMAVDKLMDEFNEELERQVEKYFG